MNGDTINYENDIVSFEEEVIVEESELTEESILTRAGRFLFYTFLVFFPLWVLPVSTGPVDINKGYFAAITLIGSLMLTLGGVLQEGRVRLLASRIYLASFVLLIVWLAASLFSINPTLSLWGLGSEAGSFANVLLGVVVFFLVPLTIRNQKQTRLAFLLFLLPVLIQTLFFFLQSVFGINILQNNRGFNLFGLWNSFGVYLGLGVAFLLPFLGSRGSWYMRLAPVWLGLVLLASLFINFSFVWGALAVVALFFVALALSQREQKSQMFATALFVLLASVLFVLLNSALGSYFSNSFESFGKPQEVVLSLNNSFRITQNVLAESPVLGSGPSTFGLDWDLYKNPDINRTIFWQVRFASGFNTFLTFVAETGIVGALAMLLFLGMFLWHGIRALGSTGGEGGMYVRASFAGALFLIVMWFLYPFNLALVLLTFISMALFYVSLRDTGNLAVRDINLFATKERGFVFSLLIIFLLVGGVAGVYYHTTRYLGNIAFADALEVLNTEGALNTAGREIRSAIDLDGQQDRYYRTLAQLEIIKMQRELSNTERPQEERLQIFSEAYNAGVSVAREAVNKSDTESANYRTLAQVHELGIPVDERAGKAALENYEKARELSPLDPSLLVDEARVHIAIADLAIIRGGGSSSRKVASEERQKAIQLLIEATEMKPNYSQAHFTLSQLYVAEEELAQAITRAEATTSLVPNDTGVLFQLGLLYYQRGSFNQAQVIFERSIKVSPNFSNARYFLGLVHDRAGRTEPALEQFRRVLELNPNNVEVKAIIDSLESGGSAAAVLGQPPPEERETPPVREVIPVIE
ncbi:MAG: tetratricopeptide repeat protein [bacterium]|nr:tetratricopeptide repeat protein [bacterium]